MSWNYRLIQFDHQNGETCYSIHEVYYDNDGRLNGYAESTAGVVIDCESGSFGKKEFFSGMQQLANMQSALSKSILTLKDFEPPEGE